MFSAFSSSFLMATAAVPPILVTDAQREQFATQGFVVFPNVLPKDAMLKGKITIAKGNKQINKWTSNFYFVALRVINAALGKMEGIKPEDIERFKNGILFPELAACEEFLHIYFSTQVKQIVSRISYRT